MADTNVMDFAPQETRQHLRILEALLFAATEPLDRASLAERLPPEADIEALLAELRSAYANRGVVLSEVAGGFAFRTAPDLAHHLQRYAVEQKRLSRAALETLSIIAYHQPVTRAEIEEVRGVSTSKGTLDILLETGWIRMRGRRRTPGRPVTYGTTPTFLDHFGLANLKDLPGLEELRGAGLLDANLPPGFNIPAPMDSDDLLADDEDPLEEAVYDDTPLAGDDADRT